MNRKLKRIIKTIYPFGIKEFEMINYYDDLEAIPKSLEKLKTIRKYIKRPKKNSINLLNQIKEKRKEILRFLEDKLTTNKSIKKFKSELSNPGKEFAEEIKLLKECERKNIKEKINQLSKNLINVSNAYELIKTTLDIEEIIPYKIKALEHNCNCTEHNSLWYYITIWSSPLFELRKSLCDKTKIIINKSFFDEPEILEIYDDLIILTEINEIMLWYIWAYIENSWKIQQKIFNWLKNILGIFTIGYIILNAINIIEWNNLVIIPVIIVYIILSWLLDE